MGVALLGDGQGRDPPVASITPGSLGVFGDNPFSKSTSRALTPGGNLCESQTASLSLLCSPHHPSHLAGNMKAELQELMNRLRKLQGAIDFGNAPMAEREELAGDVTDIMDRLFEVMKQLPDE